MQAACPQRRIEQSARCFEDFESGATKVVARSLEPRFELFAHAEAPADFFRL